MSLRKSLVILMIFLIAGCGRLWEKHDKIAIKQLENEHYQMFVNKKPYVVKAVCYSPVPIGESPLFNFMCDPAKPWITDGKLMKDMGVNTIRIYQSGDEPEFCKAMIEDLYEVDLEVSSAKRRVLLIEDMQDLLDVDHLVDGKKAQANGHHANGHTGGKRSIFSHKEKYHASLRR